MLENLRRIIEYCETMATGLPVPTPHIVADENQGTTVLNNPTLEGPQVVISLPLAKLTGNSDAMAGPLTFLIYTLEKAQAMTATQYTVVGQYLAMVDLMKVILEKFAADIGGQSAYGTCPLLAGMELHEIELLPTAGMFGGWNGYSAAVTLK